MRTLTLAPLLLAFTALTACGSDATNNNDAGSDASSGGNPSSGGASSGGAPGGSGGDQASGGSSNGTGGAHIVAPSSRRIAAGSDSLCAVATDASVACWSASGTAGAGAKLTGQTRLLAVATDGAAGDIVCQLSNAGAISCNYANGTAAFNPLCVTAGTFTTFGLDHSHLAIANDAGVAIQGGVGKGFACTDYMSPALGATAEVDGYLLNYCARDANGAVSCWSGEDASALSATNVPISSLQVGVSRGYGVAQDGSVVGWAFDGETSSAAVYGPFTDLARSLGNAVQVVLQKAGASPICALLDNAKIVCGTDAGDIPEAFEFEDHSQVTELAVGNGFICGVRPDQTIVCDALAGGSVPVSPPDNFKVGALLE